MLKRLCSAIKILSENESMSDVRTKIVKVWLMRSFNNVFEAEIYCWTVCNLKSNTLILNLPWFSFDLLDVSSKLFRTRIRWHCWNGTFISLHSTSHFAAGIKLLITQMPALKKRLKIFLWMLNRRVFCFSLMIFAFRLSESQKSFPFSHRKDFCLL